MKILTILKEHYMTGKEDLIRQYLFQIEALQSENKKLKEENKDLKKKNEMQSAQLVAGKNYAFDNNY